MSKKKLLVTGAHGFVAGSVLAQAGEEWEVHALSRGPEPQPQLDPLDRPSHPSPLALGGGGGGNHSPVRTLWGRWHWHQCDPLDGSQLTHLFGELRPHSVIHPAALADIDFCEKHP